MFEFDLTFAILTWDRDFLVIISKNGPLVIHVHSAFLPRSRICSLEQSCLILTSSYLSIFLSVCLPNCISLSPCPPTFPYFPFFFLFFFFLSFPFLLLLLFPLLYYSSSFSFFPFFLHLPFLFSKISEVPPDLPSSGAIRALLQTVRALVICNVLSLLTSARNT